MAIQMLDVYVVNKTDDPSLSDREILRRTLLGSPEKDIARIVLSNESSWKEDNSIINQIILTYVTELWKSYFKTDSVPDNKKRAIEEGVDEAIKNLEKAE